MKKILPPSISTLIFSGMGFMLLLVLVVFERKAFDLLFDVNAAADNLVLDAFNALRMVIDVLPYTLGPFILATFISGFIVAYRSQWAVLPTIAFIIFVLLMVYNIFIADTVTVVETLKNTSNQNTIENIRQATQGAMRQHHIGVIGFGLFFLCHLLFLNRNLKNVLK